MTAKYHILDEPRPGPMAKLAMNPMIPFVAFMLSPVIGSVLFLVNALALRGARLPLEIGLLAAAAALRIGGSHMLAVLYSSAGWPFGSFRYALAIPLGLAILAAYKLYTLQLVSHELKAYYAEPQSGG